MSLFRVRPKPPTKKTNSETTQSHISQKGIIMAQNVVRGISIVFLIIFTGVAGLAWLLSRPWAQAAITKYIGEVVDHVLFSDLNKKPVKKGKKHHGIFRR